MAFVAQHDESNHGEADCNFALSCAWKLILDMNEEDHTIMATRLDLKL
jgi:hypothetical protein